MQSDTYIFRMDGVAVRLARLKKEAQREWRRKWRQAAPSTPTEWKALAGEALIGFLKIALIIALPFVVLVRGKAMIRAILRKPISASPASAFHSVGVDGAACRHFRRHSRCASFLRRANRTATPSMRKMYVSDCIRASTSSNRHPVVRGISRIDVQSIMPEPSL